MKAVIVGPKFGNSDVRIISLEKPEPLDSEVLVRVTHAGLNPLDYNLINGNIVYNLKPVPHIPGSEIIGIVESDSGNFRKGQRVLLYNRVFDGTCDRCRSHQEHLCINGGIWGVVTNGGYTEYVSVPEKNLLPIPDDLDNETAVSIPIGALTAYRALKRAGAEAGKSVLIYGASGNT
ncbi:MAG: alcohol dehydrogenase catalytic domain-containing protein, partial [Candidatus Thermoplasmatota archaeon]|nr:alcohol dehydrogenase catalytic domain-containing protein [Candidatus Thermoplasmatota archaeon]